VYWLSLAVPVGSHKDYDRAFIQKCAKRFYGSYPFKVENVKSILNNLILNLFYAKFITLKGILNIFMATFF